MRPLFRMRWRIDEVAAELAAEDFGRGGRVGMFRNNKGRLTPQAKTGPVAPADLTTILGLRENGRSRLLAGVSNWEGQGQSVPAVLGVMGSRNGLSESADAVVPSQASATGPMALGDYDGNGDLDLFVGGRAVAGRYPEPASSALFESIPPWSRLEAKAIMP